MEQEQERGITITSAAVTCTGRWTTYLNTINIIEATWTHVNSSLAPRPRRRGRGFDGVAAWSRSPRRVWRQRTGRRAHFCFINKLDRTGGGVPPLRRHDRDPAQRRAAGHAAADRAEADFKGVIDLDDDEGPGWNARRSWRECYDTVDIPATHTEAADGVRGRSETGMRGERRPEMMDAVPGGRNPTDEQLYAAVAAPPSPRRSRRVFCGNAFKNKGVQPCSTRSCATSRQLDVDAIDGHKVNDEETVLHRKPSDHRAAVGPGVQDHERSRTWASSRSCGVYSGRARGGVRRS